jgi:hypothetical protein
MQSAFVAMFFRVFEFIFYRQDESAGAGIEVFHKEFTETFVPRMSIAIPSEARNLTLAYRRSLIPVGDSG